MINSAEATKWTHETANVNTSKWIEQLGRAFGTSFHKQWRDNFYQTAKVHRELFSFPNQINKMKADKWNQTFQKRIQSKSIWFAQLISLIGLDTQLNKRGKKKTSFSFIQSPAEIYKNPLTQ